MTHALALLLALAMQPPTSPPADTTAAAAPAAAEAPAATPADDDCLMCHSDKELTTTLGNGETRSLFVDPATIKASVHGGALGCLDCHAGFDEMPHPTTSFQTKRDVSVAFQEQCTHCHFATFKKTLDSVHHVAQARGDTTAPLCTDCHGAHNVASPSKPRSRISQTCAKCHAGISTVYSKSVHGKALVDDDNPDVPTCTDCHRSHDTAGPHASDWRAHTPEMCATCHGDKQVMDKYGLSVAVHQTYLTDFHGVTARLRGSRDDSSMPVIARCTDCHGVHDITKTDDPNSPVLKANLQKTCQRCHEGATESFPDAWMSHYEPSWSRTPLVYAVTLGYKFLIPFMIGGLILQILLHIWRVVVNR